MEIKTILVPTDFSEHAGYAYKWALSLAADCKAKLVLFYAAPTMAHLAFPESVYYPDLARMEREMIVDAEKRLNEFVATKGTGTVPVETRVALGEAVWEICRIVEREHVD